MTKKPDAPLITMRVEKGRLVPASAFDLELLNDWHDGAVLNVEVTRTVVRPKEKAYFAALTKLLDVADTPWTNTQEAHDALKKLTGFVTFGKNYKPRERRIGSFDDAELDEYVELFYGIVSARFGIDPQTLAKEASDSSGLSSSKYDEADDGPGAGIIPVSVGVDESPSEIIEPIADGVPEGGGGVESTPDDPSPPEGKISEEDWDWLKMAARMMVAATGKDTDILTRQRNAIRLHHTPHSISNAAKQAGNAIFNHCMEACRGKPLDKDYVAGLAGCEVSDLRPEAR
jgi:hypothetical protein